eukprot:NODE_141_length_2229_cov_131.746789_g114_i0.p1 GENE.NODE_141_length_2229_cov_131.746789_g114_i0~~NODE_141_length_2229_cov_131.746789_g114_i0.p1  ORF type:complete len:592 (-),score=171.33 NODE_141_length_2229_cov_131.746789_g114_i0:388-2163(-)
MDSQKQNKKVDSWTTVKSDKPKKKSRQGNEKDEKDVPKPPKKGGDRRTEMKYIRPPKKAEGAPSSDNTQSSTGGGVRQLGEIAAAPKATPAFSYADMVKKQQATTTAAAQPLPVDSSWVKPGEDTPSQQPESTERSWETAKAEAPKKPVWVPQPAVTQPSPKQSPAWSAKPQATPPLIPTKEEPAWEKSVQQAKPAPVEPKPASPELAPKAVAPQRQATTYRPALETKPAVKETSVKPEKKAARPATTKTRESVLLPSHLQARCDAHYSFGVVTEDTPFEDPMNTVSLSSVAASAAPTPPVLAQSSSPLTASSQPPILSSLLASSQTSATPADSTSQGPSALLQSQAVPQRPYYTQPQQPPPQQQMIPQSTTPVAYPAYDQSQMYYQSPFASYGGQYPTPDESYGATKGTAAQPQQPQQQGAGGAQSLATPTPAPVAGGQQFPDPSAGRGPAALAAGYKAQAAQQQPAQQGQQSQQPGQLTPQQLTQQQQLAHQHQMGYGMPVYPYMYNPYDYSSMPGYDMSFNTSEQGFGGMNNMDYSQYYAAAAAAYPFQYGANWPRGPTGGQGKPNAAAGQGRGTGGRGGGRFAQQRF